MERTTLSAVFVLGVRLALFRDCAARPRASGSRIWRTSGGRKSPARGDTGAPIPEGSRSGIAGVMARTATNFRFKGGEISPAGPNGSGGRRGRPPTSLVSGGNLDMNSKHRGARAALSRAAAVVVAAVAPGVADAGQYPMYAGDVPNINLAAPSQAAWTFYDTSGQISRANTFPTRTFGAEVTWAINYPTGFLAQNTGVGIQLKIPSTGAQSAIDIARVTDWSETYLTAQHVHGGIEPPAYGLNVATGLTSPPGGTASGWNGFSTSGPGHDSGALQRGTKERQIGVYCAYYGGNYTHCTLPTPFLLIRGLKTMLYEGVQPSGAIDGGSITAGGSLSGTKSLAFTAADQESGVEKVEALLDDVVVATESNARDLSQPVYEQSGSCKYVDLRACPASMDSVLSVDTNKVPDGAYELSLRVTDAAGNAKTVLAGDPVVVDNHPAPVNTELPAITGDAVEGQILGSYVGLWRTRSAAPRTAGSGAAPISRAARRSSSRPTGRTACRRPTSASASCSRSRASTTWASRSPRRAARPTSSRPSRPTRRR